MRERGGSNPSGGIPECERMTLKRMVTGWCCLYLGIFLWSFAISYIFASGQHPLRMVLMGLAGVALDVVALVVI